MSSDTISAPGVFHAKWSTGNTTLDNLSIELSGRVIVSYDPSRNSTATIEATSTSQGLLDLIQVTTKAHDEWSFSGESHKDGPKELKLHFDDSKDVDVEGNLLVHIYLNTPITHVATTTETIFQEGSLGLAIPSSNVSVSSLGGKDVWVDASTPVNVNKLDFNVAGSGSTFFNAPSVQVKGKLAINVLGSGSLGIKASNVEANTIDSNLLGSGSIYVEGSVEAPHLRTNIAGSGAVNLYPSGHCDDSDINIVGSGDAYIASVACQNTTVNTLGRGDAYVQTIDTLKHNGFGKGAVKYFNSTPLHLPQEKHTLFFFKSPKTVQTTENKHKTLKTDPEPPLTEGTHVHVTISHSGFSWSFGSDEQVVPRQSLNSRLGASPDFGAGAVIMMVVAILAFVVWKKTKRTGYQPLL